MEIKNPDRPFKPIGTKFFLRGIRPAYMLPNILVISVSFCIFLRSMPMR